MYTSIVELQDLLYARHHSDTGRNVLLSLCDGDDSLWTQCRYIVAFDLQDLVTRLQPCQVGTAAFLHRQDVTGPTSTQLEAKVLGPSLVGRWHVENFSEGRRK